MTAIAQVAARTGVPAPTLKRWRQEGCWPGGRAALQPIEQFVEDAKPYRGRHRPLDVALLRLAGERRTPTTGLPDVLIRLVCLPTGMADPAARDEAAWHVVADLRKSREGAMAYRRYRNLAGDSAGGDPASVDIAEDQADQAMTDLVDSLLRQPSTSEDFAQVMVNMASRLRGVPAEVATNEEVEIVRSELAQMRSQVAGMMRWLTVAAVDDMADAVALAVQLDKTIHLAAAFAGTGPMRDDRPDGDRWRNVGRMTPLVGANPQKVIAQRDFFTTLQDRRLIGRSAAKTPDGLDSPPEQT